MSQQKQSTPSYSAAGRGRGRGGAGRGRGQHSAPVARAPAPSPPFHVSPVTATVVGALPHAAASASSSSALTPAAPPAATTTTTAATAEALSADVQELSLQTPATIPPSSSKAVRFPRRPGYGTVGRKIQVRANHFLVGIADRDLHHYDVAISPEVTSKALSRALLNQLVRTHQKTVLGNRIPAYDGRKSIYTAGAFPFQSREFLVKLVDEDDRKGSPSSPSASKRREREYKVTIRLAAKADLYSLQQFLRRQQLECPYETIQALDVALRASPSEKYNISGRSFFSPELGRTGSLGGGVEYWKGYYQSLRPTQMGLSLNIDVSARSYYEPILVTDFVAKHFNFNLTRPLSDQDRVKIKKTLRGVKVEVHLNGNIRGYKVSGISREPLREIMFNLDDKKTKISVVQYFREKYGTELRYLNLPAIQSGSDAKPAYLPMEVCQIAPRQRYTKRLTETQVTALLKANCQRPSERERDIRQVVRQNNFSTDKHAREFGIKVAEELALVDARVLPPPRLKYHDTGREPMVDPQMGQWNMINKKMYSGGKVQHWTCLNLSRRVNSDVPFQFCYELVNMCTSKGMFFNPDPLIPITSAQPNEIERALADIHKKCEARIASTKQEGKLQLLIIILPDFGDLYGKIKRICETELGIVSQCCRPLEASKMKKQYLENVSLKINVKVGGRNTVLNDAACRRIPLVSDIPTLILGADVTHPQPGEDSSPSIAAVVGSMDWPLVTQYRGIVSAQHHREEIIQDLYKSFQDPKKGLVHGGMIRELLLAFHRSTNQKPGRIIFYRDGVSEGQFSQVLLHEMDAIRKACLSLEAGYLPKVTFAVVQKRHHTRFFPVDHSRRDQTDRSGNIMPGTVVDTKICHPYEHDFYLNSHSGIQGTSRPTHYHMLFDENNFSADGFQTLTNNLCYTYARCTRSVSIVPPAYYAHLAAFRARYYIESEISEGDSASKGGTKVASKVVLALPSVKDNVKAVMFYC